MSRPNQDQTVARVVDAVVLGLLLTFLGLQFPLSLLRSPTVTAGGDTPSHYYTLVYLTQVLLPQGRLSGWSLGHYAGFPMLEFYFPLPFLLMAACSVAVSLPVAFKLGTLIGVFLLPLCAYGCLRLMRLPFPAPVLGAIATLPLLFSEGASMWGGNISSVLAGEFAYSLGFALAVLWMGTLYEGIRTGRWMGANALLLALIGLSHGYSFLFAAALPLVWLLNSRAFPRRLTYLVAVWGIAALLLSVWLLPLLANLRWATAYQLTWDFRSWKELVPTILWPVMGLAVLEVLWNAYALVRQRPVSHATSYLASAVLCGGAFFLVAPAVGVVDIRFVAFAQVACVLLAASAVQRLTSRLKGQALIPLLVLALTCWWVGRFSQALPQWVTWNYSGFEGKPRWADHARIQAFLKGSLQDPRVVYEHSTRHDALGSIRVWESLPVYSGRATLEHAYFQASPTAPFIFYLQSEISKQISCPFPNYGCTSTNVDRAARHLELFNVREFIAISEEVKSQLHAHPSYRSVLSVPPYEIFELQGPHHYVTPLRDEPVVWTGGPWKETAYAWFRNTKLTDVHLVFPDAKRRDRQGSFRARSDDLGAIPVIPLPVSGAVLRETVSNQEIVFETSALHHPHLIKMSYHPNWTVEGADGIYLVSPAFMMVYPSQSHVRLVYRRSVWEYAGLGLSLIGMILLICCWRRQESSMVWRGLEGRVGRWVWAIAMLGLIGVLVGGTCLSAYLRANEPPALLAQINRDKDAKRWERVERSARRILQQMPQSLQAEYARYHLGIASYLQQRWEPAIHEFTQLVTYFPDSHLVAEAYWHIALCQEQSGRHEERKAAQEALQREFPQSPWAQYARTRWP